MRQDRNPTHPGGRLHNNAIIPHSQYVQNINQINRATLNKYIHSMFDEREMSEAFHSYFYVRPRSNQFCNYQYTTCYSRLLWQTGFSTREVGNS